MDVKIDKLEAKLDAKLANLETRMEAKFVNVATSLGVLVAQKFWGAAPHAPPAPPAWSPRSRTWPPF